MKNEKKININENIAVLIPCYNESKTIAKVVNDYKRALPKAKIYVYDNNSTDDTDKIAISAGATVKYVYKHGKGNVIRSMFRQIDADCYLIVDGDDTYSSSYAKVMCDYILNGEADMIVGDRLSTNYFLENKRLFHNFGNKLVRFLVRNLFNGDVNDIMTGYRAFSYSFVKTFPIISTGFEVEVEMTIHAISENLTIKEIPIVYHDRKLGSTSKLNTYKDGFKILKMIMYLFKEYKPMIFFGIFSLLFLIVFFIMKKLCDINFYNLSASSLILVISFFLFICGIILQKIANHERKIFQLLLINTNRK